MLKGALAANGKVLLCGTCMDARGLDDSALMAGHAPALEAALLLFARAVPVTN
jgi:sulfur relay (sulfurtransferase) complex TusBCD TusD component (DsrE family)